MHEHIRVSFHPGVDGGRVAIPFVCERLLGSWVLQGGGVPRRLDLG